MDEERFGSDPNDPDTDGDGLNDLAEFSAGNFFGSNPNNPDTDGDGVPDNQDKYPMYNRAEVIPYLPGGHKMDGVLEPSWSLYTEGTVFTKLDGPKVRVYANYDDEYLYIAFESNAKRQWYIELDGSGEDGRWCSPYHYVGADPNDKSKSFGDVWTGGTAFVAKYGTKTVTCRGKTVEGARIASGIRNAKRRRGLGYITEVALPRKLPHGELAVYCKKSFPQTEGIFLEKDKIFGLNIYFNAVNDAPNQYSGDWGCVFEIHHFVDSRLTGPEDLDGDGLNANQESQRGTDPADPDTDHDRVLDSRDTTPIGKRRR